MAARALSHSVAFFAARMLHGALGAPNLRFTLPDGRAVGAPDEAALATVHFQDARAPLALALDPPLAFGDLYAAGRIRVDGPLADVVSVSNELPAELGLLRRRPRTPASWRQALGRAARNARHHYDAGNDFYALWLDDRMIYTCAYFETPDRTLEEAQLAKLDLVCRKLRLRPGQRVLELGSGWGALALHMAGAYGVTVRAFNVSEQQVEWARESAEKQGLASRVEFVLDDWRNATGSYDAFASVGMLEHVGPGHYDELGRAIERTLAPDGLGLIHTIGRSRPQPLNRWIQKRVFPNAHPPALSEMMQIFEPRDFAVLDVENLRRHYALTAQHWLERYQKNRRLIDERVSKETARTFELYLAGTVAAFRDATLSLYQVVFTRARNDAVPWTRADLYRS
jgi:cyclopropane-fatty-acyl-phospholipid synthase